MKYFNKTSDTYINIENTHTHIYKKISLEIRREYLPDSRKRTFSMWL